MTLVSLDEFLQRVRSVKARIARACDRAGRAAEAVRLLPVTKTHPAQAAALAHAAGLDRVGENRVQEAAQKRLLAPPGMSWELIGHLQSNKARLAAEIFARIQSVDSQKLAAMLDKAAADLGRTLPILLQVNTGRDPAKSGAEPDQAQALLEFTMRLSHLRVEGLMTIAPLSDDPETARRTFASLRELRDRLSSATGNPLLELSMGMTTDLEAAVAEGSTLVRVGTALFGERPAPP
jgi:pyridoxal phosphate enzyme (YggS family)